MTKIKISAGWLAVLGLCILGLCIYLGLAGCRFLGLFVLGIAGVVTCFLLLDLLQKSHKKVGKWMFWIFTCGLILGLVAATVTGIFVAKAETGTRNATCDYLIVLGAGVNGSTPSLSLQDRIYAARDYLQAHPDVICVVSGGQGPGEDITEAQCMFRELTKAGIPQEQIWLEEKSTSTRENIAFSLDLIEEKTGQRPHTAGILSSEYHLYRAQLVAKEQGLSPIGVPAKTSWPHLHLSYFLREIFVVWAYWLMAAI